MFDSLDGWLRSCGADVLCLQEVTRTPGLEGWTTFRDAERTLPQRANLFNDVSSRLRSHEASFVASDAGPVSAGGLTHVQEFGLGTFIDERVTIVDHRTSFVHGEFTQHDIWAISDRPRIASSFRMIASDVSVPVVVTQLHGVRDPAGKIDTPARRHQAERLAELVRTTRHDGDFTVVCGDFNVLPDSDTFDVLAGLGLTDLVGAADTRTSRYRKPVRHASYMLVSDPEFVRDFEIVTDPEVSDHRPLVLDI